jgi:MFS family permease
VTYLALLFLGALDAAGYSLIAPIVPAISDRTGAGPAVMGALVTCFALGQLVGYPGAGRAVQLRHASWVLAAGLALMAIGDLGFVLGDSLGAYFPARLVQGLGAGGLWMGVCFAVLERYPGEEFRRLAGILASYSVGGMAGPALGAIGGIRGPFVAHLGLVLLAGVVVFALGAPRDRPRFRSDREALRSKSFWLACASVTIIALTIGSLEGPVPLHFAEELSQAQISALYVGTSLVVGACAALAARFAPRPVVLLGTILLTSGLALVGIGESVAVWIGALALLGIGFGMCESGSLGILLGTVGAERIVLAMVVWSQVFGVGYLVGPALAGAVAQAFGFAWIGLIPLVLALPVFALLLATVREPPRSLP